MDEWIVSEEETNCTHSLLGSITVLVLLVARPGGWIFVGCDLCRGNEVGCIVQPNGREPNKSTSLDKTIEWKANHRCDASGSLLQQSDRELNPEERSGSDWLTRDRETFREDSKSNRAKGC